VRTVGETIEGAIARYGDRVALDDGTVRYTFAELGELTARIAGLYREAGLRRGDRVVLLQRNSVNFLLTELALYRAGLVRVAVNVRLSPAEYAYIVSDSGAAACIHDTEFAPGIESIKAGSSRTRWLVSDEVVARAADHDPAPTAAVAPDAPVLIQYTSGTTGRPKGAVLTHASKVQVDRNILIELPAIGTDDVMLHVTPLTHASGALVLPCLLRGVRQVPLEFPGARTYLGWVREHGATLSFLVPTLMKMITEETGGCCPPEFDRLRAVMYAGSPISPENLSGALTVFGDRLLQFYGLSEAWFPITALRGEDHRADAGSRLGSAGRPAPFAEVEVLDDEGRALPAGRTGEIATRGPHVMSGYWNNHVATAAVLDPDGWFRTGDVGYLDADHYLHLVDRKNDMIISGGFNVYPLEVEDALCRHPRVADAAVYGVPDDTWGEAVVATVVLTPGDPVPDDDLRAHCKAELAGFKCPKTFARADELPRNSAGKLLRRELRAPHWRDGARLIQG
jgi:acyl-CoA synthetase (AMP-forming)/AMP-acid ligase II